MSCYAIGYHETPPDWGEAPWASFHWGCSDVDGFDWGESSWGAFTWGYTSVDDAYASSMCGPIERVYTIETKRSTRILAAPRKITQLATRLNRVD